MQKGRKKEKMQNVTLKMSDKNIWTSTEKPDGKVYMYLAFDGETFANKEEIKALGFGWNALHERWVKKIEAKPENAAELANTIKNAVDAGAEFESLIRGVAFEKIMKTAGI